jgi:hypothetical protein
VTKDQLQHHLISVRQVDLDSVQQADQDRDLQAQAARVAHARDVHFSVARFAVSVQKKTS